MVKQQQLTKKIIDECISELRNRGFDITILETTNDYSIHETWKSDIVKIYDYCEFEHIYEHTGEIFNEDQDHAMFHSKEASFISGLISYVHFCKVYLDSLPDSFDSIDEATAWGIVKKIITNDLKYIEEILSYDYSYLFPEPHSNVWNMSIEELRNIPLICDYKKTEFTADPNRRHLKFLKWGQKVKVDVGIDKWRNARVMGYDGSLFLLIDGYENDLLLARFHPLGMLKYYTDDEKLICEFSDNFEENQKVIRKLIDAEQSA